MEKIVFLKGNEPRVIMALSEDEWYLIMSALHQASVYAREKGENEMAKAYRNIFYEV